MKTRRIDYLLKFLEDRANPETLDNNEEYKELCELLARIDVDHYVPTFSEKFGAMEVIKSLYIEFRLSFENVWQQLTIMERLWEED